MNTFVIVAFFAALAAANAGVIAPSASILQGPSSRSTLVGPEGSVISSFAPGGQVVSEHHSGVVAHTAPVVAAPAVVGHTAYAAPAVAAAIPVAHAAYAAPALAATVPVAHAAGIVVAAGHGLEGQYVHDYTETLFDDGSYKPHLY